jgi:tRNA-uridine 2-sulfurtransferase
LAGCASYNEDVNSKRSLVIVAVSGGVDSAVAALLLLEQGYRVQGLFMSNWEEDDDGYCTSAQDFQDARRVCGDLNIPLHKTNFAAAYRAEVFEQFLAEHRVGRTPNPDVLCNRQIKFGACLQYARRLGAEQFATGHYARIVRTASGYRLLKGIDAGKDQSYFLHGIDPAVLPHALFPLGELTKQEVRRRAQDSALPVFDKKDSTGICFIGERPFQSFLAQYLPAQPGPIESADGDVIGRHQGLMYYTLGQRHGLGIGGVAGGPEEPWYVAAKDRDRNVLVVVQGRDHPLLLSNSFRTEPVHWLAPAADEQVLSCSVRVRYRQADQPCTLAWDSYGAQVTLQTPQRAITPGQSAVFYDGETCLGGALIERVAPAAHGLATCDAPAP